MRDLEIRGAGNLLGAEQSGHIASVGFSLYCKLLESAIEDLKGNDKDVEDVEINMNIDAYIPENYISDSRQKIEMYKKLKKTNSEADIISLIDEFVDRYGDPPQSVMNLIELSRINLLAKNLRVKEILQKDAGYRIIFREDNNIDIDFIVKLLERHPKKLKIRNSKNPEIIIKEKNLSLLKKVLTYLNEQTQSIGE
jgi:transcription-repair coupling factor (superfamily II helicase)